jgi:hypothetical protein
MLIVREYRFEDLLIMPPRDSELDVAKAELETPEIFANRASGPAHTICLPCAKQTPVLCAGIIIFQPGVGEAWVRGSLHMQHLGISLARTVKRWFDAAMLDRGLHRVQVTVRCTDKVAYRFAQFIGFGREGIMRQLSADKADFYMMARIN